MDEILERVGEAIASVWEPLRFGDFLVKYVLVCGIGANLVALGFVIDYLFY